MPLTGEREAFNPKLYHPEVVALDVIFTPGVAPDGVETPREEGYTVSIPYHPYLPLEVHGVGRSYWIPGDTIERPLSAQFVVEFVTQGRGELVVNGAHHTVTAGDVFLLHPGEHQRYRALPGGEFRKYYFNLVLTHAPTRHMLQSLRLDEVTVVHLPPPQAARVQQAYEHLVAIFRERAEGYRIEASAQAYRLLLDVAATAHGYCDTPVIPKPIERAMRDAYERVAEPLSINHMAREAGYSPAHLNRLMTQCLGMHAHQWLERMKMHEAATLLSKTTLKVYDIAERVGYENPYYFSRAFRRITCMTPLEYRRRCFHGPVVPLVPGPQGRATRPHASARAKNKKR